MSSTLFNPTLRKPIQRAFTRRLVGLLPEPEEIPVQPAQSSIAQAQATVGRLMEAVAAAQTKEEEKQAVRDSFAPAQIQPAAVPVKRGRGRPRLYAGVTKLERDRERKRDQRARAKSKLAQLLKHFELGLTSQIPPGLKTKYEIEVNTYRELLESEKVQTKVLKEITRDLKMIGAIKTPTRTNMSLGMFITDAPHGKGKLISGGFASKKIDITLGMREEEARQLSGDSFDPEDPMCYGDRRRAYPPGAGPDNDEE